MATTFTMQLIVEPKETFGDGAGHIPPPVEISSWLLDQLADWTKHEAQLPFRVTGLSVGEAISSTDLEGWLPE